MGAVDHRLAQAGESVVVLEKEPVPGGLAAGFRVGDAYLERFYHHLFRTDTTAIALAEELGLGDALYWGQPNTSVLHNGRIHSVTPETPVMNAMEVMAREDVNQLPVMSDGHLAGILSRAHVLELLRARSEMGATR